MTVASLDATAGSLPGIVRGARVTQLILSMCMGWSLVFCSEWQFWSATKGEGVALGDKMTARMINALIFSFVSFAFIIGIDMVADKMKVGKTGFIAVTQAFVLGLGMAWAGAFSEAMSCMSHMFADEESREYADIAMTFVLCIVVLPAWFWYMLPKVMAGPQPLESDKPPEKEAKKPEDAPPPEPEETKSNCMACGTEFEDGAQFCQNCGGKREGNEVKVGAEEAADAPLLPAAEQPAAEEQAAAEQPASKAGFGKGTDGKGAGRGGKAGAQPAAAEEESWGDGWGGDGGHEGGAGGEASF